MEIPFCTGITTASERAQVMADPAFRLIETFGFRPDRGVARLELHLSRLGRSAAAFGIPYVPEQAVALIEGIVSGQPKRCRLTVAANGDLDLTLAAMPVAAQEWRFEVFPMRLQSADVFLQHKTTRRDVYDQARAALPAGIDEYVFLNERAEVCEGTITNIVVVTQDGAWLTPAVASGCLPGVFRQSLIATGRVTEAVLTQLDLTTAKEIYFTNALRGLIPAKHVPAKHVKVSEV